MGAQSNNTGQKRMGAEFDCDVAIIGAGFSGLHAARLLSKTHNVRLVEARDRIGGRALLHRFKNGDEADLGGQWAGPGQDRLYKLIADLGFHTYPLWDEGDHLVHMGRKNRRYRGTIPKLPPHVLLDLHRLMRRFEKMAAGIDPAKPYQHPKAKDWDRETLASWLKKRAFTRTAYDMFAIGIGAVFAAEPQDISLLHALFYARSGQSLENLLSVTGGAQQDRVHGGMGGLADAMAKELGPNLLTDWPVRIVEWNETGVTLHSDKESLRARRAIFALPPNQLLRMRFSPVLPARRDQLWQKMPAGSCIKCIAQYDRPFWRKAGLSGQAVGRVGPVRVTFDNSEAGKDHGLLLGFIEGDHARHWTTIGPDERREAVLLSFAGYFGDEALAPIDYVDQDWSVEEWTRGCYAALMGLGVWTSYGDDLRKPIGPLHMAGTETAVKWYGYFEGALEAAERAVGEVRLGLV